MNSVENHKEVSRNTTLLQTSLPTWRDAAAAGSMPTRHEGAWRGDSLRAKAEMLAFLTSVNGEEINLDFYLTKKHEIPPVASDTAH